MLADANAGIEALSSSVFATATDEEYDDTGSGPVVKQWSLNHEKLISEDWCSANTFGSFGGSISFPTPFTWPSSCPVEWNSGVSTVAFQPAIIAGCTDTDAVITYWLKALVGIETEFAISVDGTGHTISLDLKKENYNDQNYDFELIASLPDGSKATSG